LEQAVFHHCTASSTPGALSPAPSNKNNTADYNSPLALQTATTFTGCPAGMMQFGWKHQTKTSLRFPLKFCTC